MPGLNDPIADLKAELAEETKAAAAGDDKAPKPGAEDDEPEEKADGESTPEVKADEASEAKADEAPKQKFVPVSRVNEEAAKRRKADRENAELRGRLAAFESAGKDSKDTKPVSEADRKQVVAEARQLARLEVMAEGFVNAGYEEYGQAEFDSISSSLSDLGAPDNLVVIAIEATGSAVKAAQAIYNLGQLEAKEIEALFQMSPIRLGAKLATLAPARKAKVAEPETYEPKPKANGKPAAPQVSRAPAPIKPVGGNGAAANDDDITDDLSEEQFTARFDKLMDKSFARRNR